MLQMITVTSIATARFGTLQLHVDMLFHHCSSHGCKYQGWGLAAGARVATEISASKMASLALLQAQPAPVVADQDRQRSRLERLLPSLRARISATPEDALEVLYLRGCPCLRILKPYLAGYGGDKVIQREKLDSGRQVARAVEDEEVVGGVVDRM